MGRTRDSAMKIPGISRLVSLALSVFAASCVIVRLSAATVVLAPVKDNTIYSPGTPALSNGIGDSLFAGRTGQGRTVRTLVAFSLAGRIPAGAKVDSVALTLRVNTPHSANAQTVAVHRLLADWGEGLSAAPRGEGGGAAATTGDTTWLARFFNTSAWTTAGGDFAPTASSTQLATGSGVDVVWSTPALAADVQAWLDQPASDFGWILIAQNEATAAVRFSSREGAPIPSLVVNYTEPPAGVAPAITTQPLNQTVPAGATVRFSVVATGQPAPIYQWRRAGFVLEGATNAELTLSNVQAAAAGAYDVVVSNSAGSVTSTAAALVLQTVVGWGDNSGGALDIPPAAAGAIDVVAATAHSLALLPDGTVVRWGLPSSGSGPVVAAPATLTGIVRLSSRVNHVLALRADGTVLAWGKNNYAQCDVPAGLSDVVAVAAGDEHSFALKADGSVVHWGRSELSGLALVPPAGLTGVVRLTSGAFHGVGQKADGTLTLWGWTGAPPVPEVVQVPAGVTAVAQFAAGYNSNVVRLADGAVAAWGLNDGGQADVPAGLTGVSEVVSGDRNAVALKTDGTVVQWGSFFSGTPPAFSSAAPPAGLVGVKKISSSNSHTLAVIDPQFYSVAPVQLTATVGQLIMSRYGGGTIDRSILIGRMPPGMVDDGIFYRGVPTAPGVYNVLLRARESRPGGGSSLAFVPGTFVVNPAVLPVISVQPVSQTVSSGQNVSLGIFLSREEVLTFQWRKDGTPVAGATGKILTLTGVEVASAGSYDVVVTNSAGSVTSAAATIAVLARHSADVSPADGTINLAELTRVIALYNTRQGTVRTSRYQIQDGTEDGFAPDVISPGHATITLARYHSADSNRDGRLSLTELTRVIELFNTRSGSTRTGAYHNATSPTATEDGFAPGP